MSYKIMGSQVVSVGTYASSVELAQSAFLIQNTSAAAVYFRERSEDGIPATPQNAFRLPPDSTLATALRAKTLSLYSEAENSSVAILLLDDFF